MATTTITVLSSFVSANDSSVLDVGHNYAPGNYTTYQNSTSIAYNAILTVAVPTIMFACGVFGNVLALVVLGVSRKKHRKTVFYRLVGALACTDLFGIISLSPTTILVYSKGRTWIGGTHLCHYFSFMMIFSGIATLLIVGAMALERFMAILHPYAYEARFSTGKVKYIVIGIWVISAFIALLPVLGLGENVIQYPGTWCFFDYVSDKVTGKIFTYFYASVGLSVIFVTAMCNLAVMIVLVKMRHSAKDIKPSTIFNKQSNKLNSEVQMMILLGGIIVVFATCYAPLMVRLIINQSGLQKQNYSVDLWAIRMACINQILDPWVYILFRKELFVKIWALLHCKLKAHDKQIRNSNSKKSFKRVSSSVPESKECSENKQEVTSPKLHFLNDFQCCSPLTKKHIRKGSGKSLLIPLSSYGGKINNGEHKVPLNVEDKKLNLNLNRKEYYEEVEDSQILAPLNIPTSVSYP